MDFRTLSETEREQLASALRGNANDGLALLMDRGTTRFIGTATDLPEDETITAVKSIPSHY